MEQTGQQTIDDYQPEPVLGLRAAANMCGVSLATMKRRIAAGDLPEAFKQATGSHARLQWVIWDHDLETIAIRNNWTIDRARDDDDARSLQEARTVLRQTRKALQRTTRELEATQDRGRRLQYDLDQARHYAQVQGENMDKLRTEHHQQVGNLIYGHEPALVKAQNEANTARSHNRQLQATNQRLSGIEQTLRTDLTATTARAVAAETATTKAEAALSPRALRKLRQQP